MLIWIDEQRDQAIDLGDPLAVWSAFSEMAKAAPGEEWPELYGVPHAAEQEVPPEWLQAVREQAARFLEQHGGNLSDQTEDILYQLSGQERDEETTESVAPVAPRRQTKKTIKRDSEGMITEILEEEISD